MLATGNPPMNFMTGQVQRDNGQVNVQIGDFSLAPAPVIQSLLKAYDGQQVAKGIRAENMETLNTPTEDALKVRVLAVEPLGSQNLLMVKIGDDTVKVSTHPTFKVAPDEDVWLRFPADKIRWIDRDSGKALYP